MGECYTGSVEVVGSSPITSTITIILLQQVDNGRRNAVCHTNKPMVQFMWIKTYLLKWDKKLVEKPSHQYYLYVYILVRIEQVSIALY